MATKQNQDDDMDDITDDIDDGDDIEGLLQSFESYDVDKASNNLIARRRIEDLLEERRLREQIGDYMDYY